jgi:hypothetical protein
MAQLIMGFFPLIACISVATSNVKLATASSQEAPTQGQFSAALRAPATTLQVKEVRQEAKSGTSARRKDQSAPWLKV